MSLLAQRRQGEVKFSETDYLQVLDQPVKSSGVLIYRRRIIWRRGRWSLGRSQ